MADNNNDNATPRPSKWIAGKPRLGKSRLVLNPDYVEPSDDANPQQPNALPPKRRRRPQP